MNPVRVSSYQGKKLALQKLSADFVGAFEVRYGLRERAVEFSKHRLRIRSLPRESEGETEIRV